MHTGTTAGSPLVRYPAHRLSLSLSVTYGSMEQRLSLKPLRLHSKANYRYNGKFGSDSSTWPGRALSLLDPCLLLAARLPATFQERLDNQVKTSMPPLRALSCQYPSQRSTQDASSIVVVGLGRTDASNQVDSFTSYSRQLGRVPAQRPVAYQGTVSSHLATVASAKRLKQSWMDGDSIAQQPAKASFSTR